VTRALTIQQQQARLAWFFLAPALAVLAVIGVYPLLMTVYLSFTDAFAGSSESTLIGVANYAEIFRDKDFLAALVNTLVFAAVSVSLEFILGLAIALVIDSQFAGRNVVRAAILIPWALPTVVSAKMWAWMLNDSFGVINDLLMRKLHVIDQPITWMGANGWAMASVIAVDVWKTTPFFALLLLAGLQIIPRDVYEAADVDGASRLQQFFAITLPLLKPTIATAVIFRCLDALRVFDVIWILPQGRFGTESLGTYAYRQLFDYSRSGYGSAVCVALFALILAFVVVYLRITKPEEE
jgi:trehalose/maltose transport system permease protein